MLKYKIPQIVTLTQNICCHIITYYKKGGHRASRAPKTFIMRLASTPKSQGKDSENSILAC